MMKSCLICLSPILNSTKHQNYHDECLVQAFGSLNIDPQFDFSSKDFFAEAKKHLVGFCLAGVQAKHMFAIHTQGERKQLSISNQNGQYILKPCPPHYKNLDSNELVSQKIMQVLGFNVPLCGLVKFKDDATAFFIKRYDRPENGTKIHQEDMLAALGIPNANENIKYQGNYETVAHLMKKIGGKELAEQFIRRVIAAYLIGNGDYHLKNISIVYMENGIELSPVYDFVNTHMYGDTDLLCLDLLIDEQEIESFEDFYCLKKKDFVALANQVEVPAEAIIEFIENNIVNNLDKIFALIQNSLLDEEQKESYQSLIKQRVVYLTS